MSDESSEDLGSIAWPGFVDILSSVIIMFVFFVMIVASALYFHIIIFKSKILAQLSQSTESSSQMQELSSTNETLQIKVKELENKLKIYEQTDVPSDVQVFQSHTEFAESENQTIEEREQERTIVVFFGIDSISITEDSQRELSTLIEKYATGFSPRDGKVRIIASKNPKVVNDVIARRLAVARMLNVRNLFLNADTDISPDHIVPVLEKGEEINETFHWVKVIFE
ncbi:MAG: hypothetical protein EOM12_09440 [Verrucomicrobiae bacterium]|nr:hypothetical protein [Verrucomicrobiae bacterium]